MKQLQQFLAGFIVAVLVGIVAVSAALLFEALTAAVVIAWPLWQWVRHMVRKEDERRREAKATMDSEGEDSEGDASEQSK